MAKQGKRAKLLSWRRSISPLFSDGVHDPARAAGVGGLGRGDELGERRLVGDLADKADRQLDDEIAALVPLAGDSDAIAGAVAEAFVEGVPDRLPGDLGADVRGEKIARL